MSDILTRSRIDSIIEIHTKKIDEGMEISSDRKLLHVELTGLSTIVVLQILIPIFTAVTGGIITHKLTKDYYRGKSLQEIKDELYILVGKEMIILDAEKKEECVIYVHEALKPFGTSRTQSRNITKYLLNSIEKDN